MAEEYNTSVVEQAELEIDFFGFTGENTIGEVKNLFCKYPAEIIKVFEKGYGKDFHINMMCVFIEKFFDKDEQFFTIYKESDLCKWYKTYSNKTSIISDHDDNYKIVDLCNDCIFSFDEYGYNKSYSAKYNFSGFLKEWFSKETISKWIKDPNKQDIQTFLKRLSIHNEVSDALNDETKGIVEHLEGKETTKMSFGYIGAKIVPIIESGRKQIVLTGAPGTGKTYGVREYVASELGTTIDALDNNERFKFVQFHASYNYVDFVEGLKPAMINGQQTFVRMDGVFKAFCRKAAADNSDNKYFFVIDEINRADLSGVFGELMFCLEETYRGKKGQTVTQYHNLPTYCYIEEKRNDIETDQEAPADSEVITEPVSTEFNNYCEQMKNALLRAIDCASDTRCYDNLKNNVLNEINSFNGFKTESTDNVIILTDDVFAEGFFIPENVIIIGTMNDIDRNVETFDFALRRRFRWIDVDADESILTILCGGDENNDLYKHTKALNHVVSSERSLGAAFKLGQSYFAKFKGDDFGIYFDNELRPILEEYVRGKKHSGTFIKECREAFVTGRNDPETVSSNG